MPRKPVRESKHFSKQTFTLDWERQVIRCPVEQEMPFVPGGIVHFPKETCAQCPLKEQCTTSAKGRSVSIHPDEALLIELRERQQTAPGRSKLRERVAVEHTLAHVGQWQGRRARYRGLRKNLFDLRRCAVVHCFNVVESIRENRTFNDNHIQSIVKPFGMIANIGNAMQSHYTSIGINNTTFAVSFAVKGDICDVKRYVNQGLEPIEGL